MTPAAYQELLLSLLPAGPAWPRELDTDLARTLAGLAQEFARIDGRVATLIDEADPRTTSEMLADWERLFEITPATGTLIADRLALVLYRFLADGDIKKPGLIALAAAMGYAVRIEDYTPSMAGWICAGDEMLEEPWTYFTAGCAMAGDYLAQEDVVLPWIWEVIVTAVPATQPSPGLEEVLNDLKAGHIRLNFTYL